MPANGRRDLIRRLKVNDTAQMYGALQGYPRVCQAEDFDGCTERHAISSNISIDLFPPLTPNAFNFIYVYTAGPLDTIYKPVCPLLSCSYYCSSKKRPF
jgi:hypothetical protein